MNEVKIQQIFSVENNKDTLSELLMRVVEDGSSVGFLPPLQTIEAEKYWESVLNSDVFLWIAKLNGQIVGSVQLHLCTKQNGKHRAEIAKLMTHPKYRRKGIGRALMEAALDRAEQENRSLVVLDTREGDPSNHLYRSLGFLQGGRIPKYAKSANGELHATIFYYKSE